MVVVVAEEKVVVTPADTIEVVFSAVGRGPPHNFALFAWHPYVYITYVLQLILKCRILLPSDAPGIMLYIISRHVFPLHLTPYYYSKRITFYTNVFSS